MRPAVLLAILVAALPGAGSAHHSIAGVYDTDRSVTVNGRLTVVEVVNPHSNFMVDAGGGTVGRVESRGVAGMAQRGFDRTAFKVGDKVTVAGAPARDGSNSLWLMRLGNGRKSFSTRR